MLYTVDPPTPSALRAAVRAAYRQDETACVEERLNQAELPSDVRQRIEVAARRLVETVRAKSLGVGGVDAFMHEYELASEEGVVLMCLAEALLRIPDADTADRLIRDKIGGADWERHLGHSESILVNASTWALMFTGRVVSMSQATGGRDWRTVLRGLIIRSGEPVIRQAVTQAMRIMGGQFVMGETISDALNRALPLQEKGYTFSYDMLGEAARTMADADRYFDSYMAAVEAIGKAAAGRGPISGPGVSVKLSALHPRYELAQQDRIERELIPRLRQLAVRAMEVDIGLTVDAEEADRLEPSLDVIEAVSGDPALRGWNGFGLAVQAYQKRALPLIDSLADMAQRHGRRLMLRLVKGAYWDSEIKWAQEAGLAEYPVFSRKASTDTSYIACARRMLAASDSFYCMFATHNAHTLATILELGKDSTPFEFQRLHGMGEGAF